MNPKNVIIAVLGSVIVAALIWPDRFTDLVGGNETVEASLISFVEKQNELTVQRAGLVSIVSKPNEGMVDMLDTKTYVIVPGTVRYVVYPAQMELKDFRWDATASRLTVSLPDPRPVDVNIDAARARVLVDGIDLQSGDERQRIFQLSLNVARKDLEKQAKSTKLMQDARVAAREALQSNFAQPLLAVGIKPEVVVQFDGDPKPVAITKG